MEKPNLETCTLQEACDYSVLKIVEQGGQCLSGKGGCAYGDEKGNHCAIGWLLDASNKQLMSCGDDVTLLMSVFDCELPSVLYNNREAFNALQEFHDADCVTGREEFLNKLNESIGIKAPQYQQWVEMGV